MRRLLCGISAAGLLALLAVLPVDAQTFPSNFSSGMTPTNLKFAVIDTGKAMRGFKMPSSLTSAQKPKAFSLTNFFPTLNIPGMSGRPSTTAPAPQLFKMPNKK